MTNTPKTISVTLQGLLDENGQPITVKMPYPTPELIDKLLKDTSIPADIKLIRQSIYLRVMAKELASANSTI